MSARLSIPRLFSAQAGVVAAGGERMAMHRTGAATLQARWQTHPSVGLARSPFLVFVRGWSREDLSDAEGHRSFASTPNTEARTYDEPMARLLVDVSAGSDGATVIGWEGPRGSGQELVSVDVAPDETSAVWLAAPGISSVAVTGGSFGGLYGATMGDTLARHDWTFVERVGLPGDPDQFADVGYDDADMGLRSSPTDPVEAAWRRLNVGAPQSGWAPALPSGAAVEAWRSPGLDVLLDEQRDSTILGRLHDLMAAVPEPWLQKDWQPDPESIPPPQQEGTSTSADQDASVRINALHTLCLATASDPYAALAWGFGTAYTPEELHELEIEEGEGLEVLVVLDTEIGVLGQPYRVELCAYAPDGYARPDMPDAPASLAARTASAIPPPWVDQPAGEAVAVWWQRPAVTATAPRTASYAVASGRDWDDASIRLRTRRAGGWIPIAPSVPINPSEPARAGQVRWMDGLVEHELDGTARDGRYAVCAQDLFGLWGPWSEVDHRTSEDPVQAPGVVAAQLDLGPPDGAGHCAATLVVDLTWEWVTRTPASITLQTSVLPLADPHAPLPPPGPSGGVQLAVGGSTAPPATLVFQGADEATTAGCDVVYLDGQGTTEVAPGPAQGERIRRYRARIGGFDLDFASNPHLAVAVHATGVEQVRPWQESVPVGPRVVAAPSPVPPPALRGDRLLWTSLPGADGFAHAHLVWGSSGASGYSVYEATESALRAAAGLGAPDLAKPPLTRLTDLRALEPAAVRKAFRRITGAPVHGLEHEAQLPPGSRLIHAFVMVGASSTGIESPWPQAGADREWFVPFAIPRVAPPPAPRLEVHLDGPGVTARVTPRGAPPTVQVELRRIHERQLAADAGSMGPPCAVAAAPGWTTVANPDGTTSLALPDAPTPRWDRWWYRAVAISDDDPATGDRRGPSEPSPAVPVLVPPPPPDLADMHLHEPGSDDVLELLSFTTDAVPRATDAGSFRLTVVARDTTDPGAPALRADARLEDVFAAVTPPAAPAAAAAVTLARTTGGPAPARWYAWIRRPEAGLPLEVTVTVTDPIGRRAIETVICGPPPAPDPPDVHDVTAAAALAGVAVRFTSTSPAVPDYAVTVSVARRGPFWRAGPFAPGGFRRPFDGFQVPDWLRPRPLELTAGLDAVADARDEVTAAAAVEGEAGVRRVAGTSPPVYVAWLPVRAPATVTVRVSGPDDQAAEGHAIA